MIWKKWQIRKLGARLQPFYLFNQIKRQIKPLEMLQCVESFNFGDDVVVKLKFRQFVHSAQIVDLNNIYTSQLF